MRVELSITRRREERGAFRQNRIQPEGNETSVLQIYQRESAYVMSILLKVPSRSRTPKARFRLFSFSSGTRMMPCHLLWLSLRVAAMIPARSRGIRTVSLSNEILSSFCLPKCPFRLSGRPRPLDRKGSSVSAGFSPGRGT